MGGQLDKPMKVLEFVLIACGEEFGVIFGKIVAKGLFHELLGFFCSLARGQELAVMSWKMTAI